MMLTETLKYKHPKLQNYIDRAKFRRGGGGRRGFSKFKIEIHNRLNGILEKQLPLIRVFHFFFVKCFIVSSFPLFCTSVAIADNT